MYRCHILNDNINFQEQNIHMTTALKSKKKKLGIYYTPYELSRILSGWSIRRSRDKVLEPSFGGCGFLLSSLERFKQLGVSNPKSKLFGVDVDQNAFEFLKHKIKVGKSSSKFIQKSFLDVNEDDFKTKFSVILGNPPYVSYQNMDQNLRERCEHVSEMFGISNIKRASLWVYFIIHSLNFLQKSGKISFVLPSSAIHTDYSGKVFKIISGLFENVQMIKIRNRIFTTQGTNEMAVVFLAENYLFTEGEKGVKVREVEDLVELSQLLGLNENLDEKRYEFSPYSNVDYSNFLTLGESSEAKRLNDYYDVKIGFVTGLKKFFILNSEKQKLHGLPNSAMRPVLSNTSLAKGIEYTCEDHAINKKRNAECLLFHPKIGFRSEYIKKYIKSIDFEQIDSIQTFKKRVDWFRTDDEKIPDAFMMYLCQSGHKIILNSAKINCTNNVHRLYLKNKLNRSTTHLIAISMMSSFSQLSCDTLGREYGSGALKLEPTLAKSVQLLMPDAPHQSISSCFRKVNKLLGDADLVGAISLADNFILKYSKIDGIEEMLSSCRKIFINRLHKRLITNKSYCTVNNITNLFNKSNS